MVSSKWTLFSHSVSSASIRIVSRGMVLARLGCGARGGISSSSVSIEKQYAIPVRSDSVAAARRPHAHDERMDPARGLRVSGNAGGYFFQYFERNLLRLAIVRQIALKLTVHLERVACIKLRAQDHVAQANRVRQHRILFQLIERRFGIIVIHCSSRPRLQAIILLRKGRKRGKARV